MDKLLLIFILNQSIKDCCSINNFAPPSYFYINGDPYRNLSVEELENYEIKTDKILGNG